MPNGMTATELQQSLAGGVAGPLAATKAATGPAAAMGQMGAGILQSGMQLRAQTQRTKAMIRAEQRRFLSNMTKIMSDATMASLQQGLMSRELDLRERQVKLQEDATAPPSPGQIGSIEADLDAYWNVGGSGQSAAFSAPHTAAVEALSVPASGAGMVLMY